MVILLSGFTLAQGEDLCGWAERGFTIISLCEGYEQAPVLVRMLRRKRSACMHSVHQDPSEVS